MQANRGGKNENIMETISFILLFLFLLFRVLIVWWVFPIYWIITGKVLDVEDFIYGGEFVFRWENKIF